MSHETNFARIPFRHILRLERLESRLAPGDALLGLFAGWPDSIPAPLAEYHGAMGTPGFDFEEMLPDGESDATLWVIGSESWVLRPGLRRPSADNSAASIDDAGYGFANSSIARVLNTLRMKQSFGAALGGLSPAAQGMSNPSLALRAGSKLRVNHDGSATPIHNRPPREQVPTAVDQSGTYGELPLAFEENVGQTDSRVDFMARTAGYTAFLTPTGAVFAMSEPEALSTVRGHESVANASGSEKPVGVALHMDIVVAKPQAGVGRDELDGKVNYFIGNNPSQWRTNISTYGRVEYHDVYPGVDVAYYGKNQQLEYDFIVSPGADPSQIKLNFAGADRVEIDTSGNLVLHTNAGDFVQQKPYLYQETNGNRQEVAGSFVLGTGYSVGVSFDVGSYDPTRPLIIDPLVLGYSTYLGAPGANDAGYMIAVDNGGHAYVAGGTSALNFPVTPGAFDTTTTGGDAFLAKLKPDGSGLVYATYLGGDTGGECNPFGGYSTAGGLAIDGAGSAYVTCGTGSSDFPTTPGAFDETYNGANDTFVVKLSPDGAALEYSTYLGGAANVDYAGAIAVDGTGDAYVTGHTWASDFPTTAGAFDTGWNSYATPYITRLSADGSSLVYSTFLSVGEGRGIALDSSNNAYTLIHAEGCEVTPGAFVSPSPGGYEVCVAKLNPTGSALIYAARIGGSSDDWGYGIAVDSGGRVYTTGYTASSSFPVTPGAFDTTWNGGRDAFVTKLNAAGTFLIYSTLLSGGTSGDSDEGRGIAVDNTGHAYVTGWTSNAFFPTTPDTFQSSFGGNFDAFVTKLNSDGSGLEYSTYLGGADADEARGIALDPDGNAYVTGKTTSGFPITPGAFKKRNRGTTDAFVTKLVET